MTYATASLNLVTQNIDNSVAGKLWTYASTDSNGTIEASGYFSDGVSKGMVKGDVVLVINPSTPTGAFFTVASINTTTGTATVGSTPATFS